MLVVFSEGYTGTSTVPQDAVDHATALGIPLFPVVLDYDVYLHYPFILGGSGPGVPVPDPRAPDDPTRHMFVNLPQMDRFASLGESTGGAYFAPSHLTTKAILDILASVRNQGLTQYAVGFVPGSDNPKE